MSRNANKLVKKLAELGYTIHGASFTISRNHGQPMMNKAAGECAPCWQLRVNPMRHSTSGKVVDIGDEPVVDFPDGTKKQVCVYSFYPLIHILKTPIGQWEIDIDDAYTERLLITTINLPESWKGWRY